MENEKREKICGGEAKRGDYGCVWCWYCTEDFAKFGNVIQK